MSIYSLLNFPVGIFRFIREYRLRKLFMQFGISSNLGTSYNISNHQYISIGTNTNILPFSRMHCFDSFVDFQHSPKLVIGDNVFIGILCLMRG